MLESAIEASCVRYATAKGCKVFKLQGGAVGDPDRIVCCPGRMPWFVEFKTATGRLSPRQRLVHADLLAAGYVVTVVRSLTQFKKDIAQHLGVV